MEKVILKVELERDDISAIFRLYGGKLTDELWDKMKDTECTVEDEDLEDQSAMFRIMFSAIAIKKLLQEDRSKITEDQSEHKPFKSRFSTIMEKQQQQREELRRIKEERDKGI
jgi:hypothetical protein|nr:MAG TPA: hypothetical protein [Bacteriophage sp.]DAS88721.1 MAG TPA: hypothetical protein [Caudoviricetes sp.]